MRHLSLNILWAVMIMIGVLLSDRVGVSLRQGVEDHWVEISAPSRDIKQSQGI